jgi:TonB-dependent SusC/RagA subfamily outer membrane receptor
MMLDEVVVVGFGKQKKESLVGAVQAVKPEDLKMTSSNLSTSFAGNVPGIIAVQTQGEPGSDEAKFYIRGISTFGSNTSPLIILDGVEINATMMNNIPPESIASFSVLKDATATSLYGSRGANGVIIVTTKSGKEGKVQVNFGASVGVRKVIKEVAVLNPYEYAKYQYELGETSAYGSYDDLDIWKSVKGNDYQDNLFGRTGLQQIYNVGISGGSKDTKFNVSYARTNDKSIMMGSDYSKDNINAKLNSKLNKWFTLDFNARLSYQKVNGLGSGADTNESNAANSIVARTVIFRPIDPITAGLEDDDDSSSSYEASPYELQR